MRPGPSDRLITCLVPHGVGVELQRRLVAELGLVRVDVHSARGFIGTDPAGLFNRVEKEVLTAVVEAGRADEVFEWLYHEGRVAELEGRFLFVTRLTRATPYRLPEGLAMEGGGG